jgi:hypothetical protein
MIARLNGYFSSKRSIFGYILEELGIDYVGIFCGRLEYLSFGYVSWPFGIFCGNLLHRGRNRWHIFKPKIPIWVNFGGSRYGICWYIL